MTAQPSQSMLRGAGLCCLFIDEGTHREHMNTNYYQIMQGDCLERLRELDDNSIDSIVTDPPYGLGFMGKKWDVGVPAVDVFAECLRVLKPGGHLLAFGGSRTYHRLAVAVEDAGFEIRDQIQWVYGSGFPKSQNVSKAIDKAAGAEGGRGPMKRGGERLMAQAPDGNRDGDGTWGNESGRDAYTYAPATEAARQWDGWGTALKPAHEPIVMARKPLAGTVAANVMEHGTGAINVDGCRVGTDGGLQRPERRGKGQTGGWANYEQPPGNYGTPDGQGRWPANLIHDGSDEATAGMGDASRYFYQAKASRKDRNEGLDDMPTLSGGEATDRKDGSAGTNSPRAGAGRTGGSKNAHPTVKPTDLMRYLCRLVTPPGGTVLDPFMGSGSTGKAAALEGFNFIGIELDPDYLEIARKRIESVI